MYGRIDESFVAAMTREFRLPEAARAALWMATRGRLAKGSPYITAQVSQAEIARLAFGGNEAQAQRAVRRLMDAGLVERIERGVKGRSSVYRLSEAIPPRNGEMTPQSELIPPQDAGKTPRKDPIPSQQGAPEQAEYSLSELINNTYQNTITDGGREGIDDMFEKLWSVYPKQQGGLIAKRRGTEALRVALEAGAEFQTVMDGAAAYAAYALDQKIETRYLKPIHEFIENEMWADEYPCSRAALKRVLGENYEGDPRSRASPETAECPRCGGEGRLIAAGGGGGTYMCPACCAGFTRRAGADG